MPCQSAHDALTLKEVPMRSISCAQLSCCACVRSRWERMRLNTWDTGSTALSPCTKQQAEEGAQQGTISKGGCMLVALWGTEAARMGNAQGTPTKTLEPAGQQGHGFDRAGVVCLSSAGS